MFLLLIRRWRAKKLTRNANQQISQIHLLLDSRGADMEPGDRKRIQELLVHADDLRAGVDVPRRAQLRQAKLFNDCAEETLRILEEMLPPTSQIETGPLRSRRRIV